MSQTLTRHYKTFFGDRSHMYIDIFPGGRQGTHVGLDQQNFNLPPEKVLEAMNSYIHHCWCHPELIYADDKRNNEVWLHRHPQ